ncbi:MAG: HEAT repeat domain-containing protein [Anaerolineales bacterium]|nr:HEAT repeat domain-containing protein [Anaerolineales bacterium]
MDRKQVRQYVKQLQSDSAKERYIAALALGKSKDTSVIPALNKVATLDSNPKVRQIAYQAVKFLSKIKDEDDLRARQAEADALDDDDDDSQSDSGWGVIENILVDDEPEKSESWNYQKSISGEQGKSKNKKKKAKKSRKERRAERRDPKRRRFRFHIWIALLVVSIGALIVAYDYDMRRDWPKNRTEVLDGLDEWYTDVVSQVNLYSLALSQPEFDCGAYPKYDGGDFYLPERPKWAKPDGDDQEGLDAFYNHMDEIYSTMSRVDDVVKGFCDGRDDPRVWPTPTANPKGQIDTLLRDHVGPARIELSKAQQANASPTPEAD